MSQLRAESPAGPSFRRYENRLRVAKNNRARLTLLQGLNLCITSEAELNYRNCQAQWRGKQPE